MAIREVDAFERAKQLQRERAERASKGDGEGGFVDYFVRLGQDESVKLRFLYNLRTTNKQNQMVCVKMHDYWDNDEKRFVRAVCATEDGNACHWCAVASAELAHARGIKDKKAGKEALRAAHQKEAREHFILPCYMMYKNDEGKEVAEPKLLDVKMALLTDLMALYEEGVPTPDGDVNDITVGDFTYKRTGTGTDTRYSLQFLGYKHRGNNAPPIKRVEEMIYQSRPPVVATANSGTRSSSSFEVDEDDHPF